MTLRVGDYSFYERPIMAKKNDSLPQGCKVTKYPKIGGMPGGEIKANITEVDKQMNGDLNKAKSEKSKRKF